MCAIENRPHLGYQSDGGCVWVMVVVCESWWLCVDHGGCVWVMGVVCESWWLCVGHGGCVRVMVVV